MGKYIFSAVYIVIDSNIILHASMKKYGFQYFLLLTTFTCSFALKVFFHYQKVCDDILRLYNK